jgi:hypothetical protein
LEQLYRIEKAMDNFYLELFPLSALAIFCFRVTAASPPQPENRK